MSEARNRDNNSGSITEDINKRKRQQKENQVEVEVFQRSKKIQRSTQTKATTPKEQEKEEKTEMDKLEKLIMGLSNQIKDIKEETSSTSKAIDTITEQLKTFGQEIRVLKEESLKKEAEWEREKVILRKEMEQMKNRLEKQERKEKKNNIIIRGGEFNKETNQQEIREFVRKAIGIDIDIEDAYQVGNLEAKMTVVKMKKFEQKLEVLKRKSSLGKREIYIECDLTQDEQRIQATIRKVARDEKAKGKMTKVGYKKLMIDNTIYEWSEEEGGSLRRKKQQEPKNY